MRILKYLIVAAIVLVNFAAKAQILNPVTWSWKAEPLGNCEYNIVLTATIDPKWHVYSQNINGEGPIPTSFKFDKNKDIQLIGKVAEAGGKVHEGFDPVFEINLKYFENKMVCTQKVKVGACTVLKGSLEYMVCDDSHCLPPEEIMFSVDLKGDACASCKPLIVKPELNIDTPKTTAPVDTLTKGVNEIIDSANTNSAAADFNSEICKDDFKGFQEGFFGDVKGEEKLSLWQTIIQGLLWGFLAVLMPCVFPMIPLTVSFFTKRAETSAKGKIDALIYGGSIVLIFFLMSLPVTILGASQDSLNLFSTNVTVNVIFFLIFIVFAFSFFGFYELTIPGFITNKVDSASNTGGIIGIFFMALTLVVVSFSCTGPLLGALLGSVASGTGGKVNLIVGFVSFGVAVALPFTFFSFFPSLLKKLPKSGGWMTTFKVVLGFVELIFAIKFLANADNVMQAGYVKREIFLAIWAFLGFALFLYLVGVFRFAKEHDEGKIGIGRYGVALVALAFTVYSAYGVYCHETPLFSGFPPPKNYSWCNACDEQADKKVYTDYCEGMAAAKREGKPVMLDFTGWACVNCRKMEENVWTQPEVAKLLSENYIIISLYVDERTPLPENKKYFSKKLNKDMKTIGNKWTDMESTCFNNNSQPFYALVSTDEKLLAIPRGYTPDVKEYTDFLQSGLNTYNRMQLVK